MAISKEKVGNKVKTAGEVAGTISVIVLALYKVFFETPKEANA